METETVRIVAAIEPRLYREVLAFYICDQRPRSEVILAAPEMLRDEVKRTRPHLIVTNMVSPELKERHYGVEVRTDEGLIATINANGHSTAIHDVSPEDLLVAVDKAEEDLADRS